MMVDKIDLDDENVMKEIAEDYPERLFSLNDDGNVDFWKQFRPRSFEEVVAGMVLNRSSVMDETYLRYMDARKNSDAISYGNSYVREVLSSTYGVILYPEQIQDILKKAGTFDDAKASKVCKGMMKHASSVETAREDFIAGCKGNYIGEDQANELFDMMCAAASNTMRREHVEKFARALVHICWIKYYLPETLA